MENLAFSISTAVMLLSIPIGVVITLIVYFIYKSLYNKHVNKALNKSGDGVKRKVWLAPYTVVFITVAVEIVLAIGIVLSAIYLFSFNTNSSVTQKVVGDHTLVVTDKGGSYDVTSLTGKVEVHNFSGDYYDAQAYMDENQIFVAVDIKDSEKVDRFIVHENDATTEVLYKNADNEYLTTVPIELERQGSDEVVTIDVCLSDGTIETLTILGE